MEDVSDLLGADPNKKLHVRSVGGEVTVVGLSTHIVKSPEEITKLLMKGKNSRAVAATAMNAQSSRSHSIFTVVVEQQRTDSDRTIMKMGKLNLVDLAGSERLGKTGAEGQTAKEGVKINQSLLALGNVISGLVTGAKHISYRDSSLTLLLQDALGGNAKTVMVATLGPASYNYEETLSTLLYATRAGEIKNAPKVNEDPKDALLNQLKAQIELLKKQLTENNTTAQANCDGIVSNIVDVDFLKEVEAKHKKKMDELAASKSMNEEEKSRMKTKLDDEYQRQKQVKAESDELQMRIKQMEQTVLVGGVNLVDKAKQQEEEIRAHESKMRRQQEEQQRLAEQRKQQNEEILLAEKRYGSLKEELSEKSKKIEKIRPLIQHLEDSIEDLQVQFERDKEVQSQTIRTLGQEYALLQFVAESFIPPERLRLIEEQAVYDEANQCWTIPFLEKAGRHQKVEEVEEQHIFIQGIEGPMSLSRTAVAKPLIDPTKAAQAQKRRRLAAQHALNEFALVADIVIQPPK
jgi:kinesin family protein 3/17